VKEFVMVGLHVTCATKYQYEPFPDDPEIFHQVLVSVMLILVLVLKDFLGTKFKSLSLSLPVQSLTSPMR